MDANNWRCVFSTQALCEEKKPRFSFKTALFCLPRDGSLFLCSLCAQKPQTRFLLTNLVVNLKYSRSSSIGRLFEPLSSSCKNKTFCDMHTKSLHGSSCCSISLFLNALEWKSTGTFIRKCILLESVIQHSHFEIRNFRLHKCVLIVCLPTAHPFSHLRVQFAL